VVVITDVIEVSMKEKAGRFKLNTFLDSGSTIMTSLGRRKYASLDNILLS
jgi:hypothetical protein